uniref:AMMECR1 domain-containing protein n=1 Tax=Myotis myotis TaxID=51298 RepID=A0A7J7S200_MYOMY|nr:hypothetical protein mMyoMyo1_010118 [Myotis myotis]
MHHRSGSGNTQIGALQDGPRLPPPPIRPQELPALSCSASLPTHLEEASGDLDWEAGALGFALNSSMKKASDVQPHASLRLLGSKAGQIQTPDSLLREGGLTAPITSEFRKATKLTRYRSEKVTIGYAEYIASHSTVSRMALFSH